MALLVKLLHLALLNTCISIAGANMCSNIDIISIITSDTAIDAASFLDIPDIGVMQCARECMSRRRCRAFSFDHSSNICGLKTNTAAQAGTIGALNVVSSDVDLWPERMLNECQGHTCGITERCDVTSLGDPTCVIDACANPSLVGSKGNVNTDGKTSWNIGETVSVTCDSWYFTYDTLICTEDGSWTEVECTLLGF